MELTEMPLSQLSENTANPRVISDAKLDKLVESILVFPRMLWTPLLHKQPPSKATTNPLTTRNYKSRL